MHARIFGSSCLEFIFRFQMPILIFICLSVFLLCIYGPLHIRRRALVNFNASHIENDISVNHYSTRTVGGGFSLTDFDLNLSDKHLFNSSAIIKWFFPIMVCFQTPCKKEKWKFLSTKHPSLLSPRTYSYPFKEAPRELQ